MPSHLDLLHQWKGGNSDAGGKLYTIYNPCVLRFFINKTRDEDEAGDLLHDTFMTLKGAAVPPAWDGQEQDDAPLRPFILGVANNVFRNRLRQLARRARREFDFGTNALVDVQPGMSSIFRSRKQAQALMDGLRSIAINDQIVLELKYFEGLSSQDIASILGVPHTSLTGRLARAKERLSRRVHANLDSKENEDASLALEQWLAEIRAQLTKNDNATAMAGSFD